MLNLFRTISDRLKALFVADLALEFEAQLLTRQADRTAELLVQAEQHELHGFPGVAAQLRAGAEARSLARSAAGGCPPGAGALAGRRRRHRNDDHDPDR